MQISSKSARTQNFSLWLLMALLPVALPTGAIALPTAATTSAVRHAQTTDSRHVISFVQIDSQYLTVLARPALLPGMALTATVVSNTVAVSADRSGKPVQISGSMAVSGAVEKQVHVVVSSGILSNARQRDVDLISNVLRSSFGDVDRFRLVKVTPGGILDMVRGGNGSCLPLMSGCRTDDAVESALNQAVATMAAELSELPASEASRVVGDLIVVSDGMTGDATRFVNMTPADLLEFEESTRLAVENTVSDIKNQQINLFVLPLPGTDAVGMARLEVLATLAGGLVVMPAGDPTGDAVRLAAIVNGGSLVRIPVDGDEDSGSRPVRAVFEDVDGTGVNPVVTFPVAGVKHDRQAGITSGVAIVAAFVAAMVAVATGCLCAVLLAGAARRNRRRSRESGISRSTVNRRSGGWAKF